MALTSQLRHGIALSLGLFIPLAALAQSACNETQTQVDATPAQVSSFFKAQKKTVITFLGYSGAGYQNPEAMLDAARRVLAQYNPSRTIVNIGATAEGIGAVYELAVQGGFATTGIVSTLARANGVALAPCAQRVFFVDDTTWGGVLPGSRSLLSPTSKAMLAASHTIVAIGGGEVARDEFLAARQTGRKTRFIAADMNHQAAIDKALKKGQRAPTEFRGALAAAL